MISDDLSEYLDGDEFRSICEKANRTDAAEQRAAQLEAERDMYKQGFDALTTANEQIVKERDDWKARYEVAFNVARNKQAERDEARRALAQHVTTRAELLDTIEKLKAENEAQAKRIKELEDSDAHFSRAMSEALNEGNGVYRP